MKHLKLFFALFAMLALGVGNAWGANYEIVAKKGSGDGSSLSTSTKVTDVFSNGTYVAKFTTANKSYYNGSNGLKLGASSSAGDLKFTLTDEGKVKATTIIVSAKRYNTSKSVTLQVIAGGVTCTAQTISNSANFTDYTYTINANIADIQLKTSKYCWVESITINYEDGGSTEPVYSVTLNQPATGGTIEADKDEAAAGATVALTATPDAGYKFSAWDVKDANNAVVTVSADGKFTMPESAVTVTASFVAKTQYTIKWNVAEGSVADTKVYEGEALGSLPTAPNCSEGKVFIGWTAATTVNPDGSGITYVKATDVPTGNKEYNAVYAKAGATETITDELTQSWTQVSGTNYSVWTGKTSNSPAVYAGNSAGGNTSIQLRSNNSTSGIVTTTSGGKVKKVVVTWFTGSNGTASGRTLNVYGNSSAYSAATDLYADATSGTTLGTIVCGTSTELEIAGDYEYIGLRSNSGAMYLSKVEITWEATSYSDYSLDCEANNESYLTINETSIDFGTVAQNETVTKTLNVSGGYLAEDVTLTISGTNASFFSVNPTTIAKADEFDQDVTITYNPTATGDHTATLTIKSGEETKEVALSGKVLAPTKWKLITDIANLNVGDEIVIVSAEEAYALSTTQNNNNRAQAEVVKIDNSVDFGTDVQILSVENGEEENTFAFNTGAGYLYAASSSSNHLKTQNDKDDNASWTITIAENGVATVTAQGSNTRNLLRHNSSSKIFSCYASGQNDICIYKNTDVVPAPIISGDVDFVTSTQVTITAQSGLTVYYTTDGNTPDKTSNSYSAPFTINATTTVKAIAYDANGKASNVAEKTFTKHNLVNVATAMALAKDEIAYFDEFEVVKVVAGKGNIYIKDASGHGLIYDFTLATQLSDGDRVQGFVGISSPYSGLPEAKPYNVTYEDLTITAGTPAEPYDFTATAITETDINKYIVFQNVEITENTDMSTNPTLTIGGNSVDFYNQFGVSKTLEAGKIYDIYGFVAIKDGKLDVYFYEAAQDGEVIQKYTVTYNAGGATGTVPVDNAEYSEGAQVYLKSATSLTYEGYEYKGWKVTDANGTEISVSSNKFNMPASNVTVTAQWEAIVVTPKEDFSAGLWVLVTDASELAADDYIIVAAKDYNVAMVSYDYDVRKNNCGQTNITKFGKDNCFLTWTEDVGVFQLTASGENYTIQDVNTKQYLYAAGGTTSNHLKATDDVDMDAADKYIWTISIADCIATVQAKSEGRNILRYNATAGSSGQLFSCYASGQKDIVLYKYVTDFYTRDVTKNQYGTICLDKGGVPVSGATFYEVAYKNTQTNRVLVDEVVRLKAGVPYVFLPNANQIKIALDGTTAGTASKVNGLQGTFVEIKDGPAGTAGNILEGKHVLYNNAIQKCGGNCKLPAYRAYFLVDEITTTEPAQVPGRRRVALDYQGENQATGLDNIGAPENDAVKVLMNGQMIIIRNGEKFNAQGVKL